MKKTFLFSLIFSLCFFTFSHTSELSTEKATKEDAIKALESAKKAEEESVQWDSIIQNDLQQDIIIDSLVEDNVKSNNEENNTTDNNSNKKDNAKVIEKVVTDAETKIEDETSEKQQTEEKGDNVKENTKENTEANLISDELKESEETESQNIQEEETAEETEEQVIKKIPLSIASEEILSRPDVEKFRQQYMSPKWSSLLHSYLESAMEYRLYVRQQIQERNLPEVLEYLPVVESNYKTSAKSYSGAVGMWQFMANSVYPFLTLNDFVDERLDPWYSTDAGLSKLEDNYKYFGDWLIAIAAYNCGGGAMTKAIRNAGVKDFWYLADNGYLPKQTVDYIPKLLAIADLAINSEYYGIDLPNHNEEFEVLENEKNGIFDYITVNKAYSINELAKELRIEQSTMAELNASYTMGITHPTKESKIRLPSGMASAAEAAIEKLTPIDYPFKYKVVSGDSLWSISRKYHVTVSEICELNNIKENDILSIGKILYIPSK